MPELILSFFFLAYLFFAPVGCNVFCQRSQFPLKCFNPFFCVFGATFNNINIIKTYLVEKWNIFKEIIVTYWHLKFTSRATRGMGYDAGSVEGQKEYFDKKHAGLLNNSVVLMCPSCFHCHL